MSDDFFARYLRAQNAGPAPIKPPSLPSYSSTNPSALEADAVGTSPSGNEDDYFARYLKAQSKGPPPVRPSSGGIGSYLSAALAPQDVAFRAGARHLFDIPVADDATAAQALTSGLGLRQGGEGHAATALRSGIEFGADLALNPLTYALPGEAAVARGATAKAALEGGSRLAADAVGGLVPEAAAAAARLAQQGAVSRRVSQAAGVGFTGMMGAGLAQSVPRLYHDVVENGWTPEATGEAVSAGLGAAGAGLGAAHLIHGFRTPYGIPEPVPTVNVPLEGPVMEGGIPRVTQLAVDELGGVNAGVPVEPIMEAPIEERVGDRRQADVATDVERRVAERRTEIATRHNIPEDHPLVDEAARADVDPTTGVLGAAAHARDLESPDYGGHVSLDLAGLKRINDTHGHGAGDQFLQQAAQTMSAEVERLGGRFYRKGGDEFAILGRDEAHAKEIAQAVKVALHDSTIDYTAPDGTVVDSFDSPRVDYGYAQGQGQAGFDAADQQLLAYRKRAEAFPPDHPEHRQPYRTAGPAQPERGGVQPVVGQPAAGGDVQPAPPQPAPAARPVAAAPAAPVPAEGVRPQAAPERPQPTAAELAEPLPAEPIAEAPEPASRPPALPPARESDPAFANRIGKPQTFQVGQAVDSRAGAGKVIGARFNRADGNWHYNIKTEDGRVHTVADSSLDSRNPDISHAAEGRDIPQGVEAADVTGGGNAVPESAAAAPHYAVAPHEGETPSPRPAEPAREEPTVGERLLSYFRPKQPAAEGPKYAVQPIAQGEGQPRTRTRAAKPTPEATHEAALEEAAKSEALRLRDGQFVQPAEAAKHLTYHLKSQETQAGRGKGGNYRAPTNAVVETKKDGKTVSFGPVSFSQWFRRAADQLGGVGSGDWQQARSWYKDLRSAFVEKFGEDDADKELVKWALSQQRASPSAGMTNSLRATDKVRGFLGLKQAGLAEDRIMQVERGEIPGSIGQKLSDFYDSVHGKTTRSWVGDQPRGGMPAAIDTWAIRDAGYVDDTTINYAKKVLGEKYANRLKKDVPVSYPDDAMYEHGLQFYAKMADSMNQRGIDGGNWTPAEAQAVGWVSFQKMVGRAPEGAADIFVPNLRQVAIEAGPGAGAPALRDIGIDWHSLEPRQQAAIAREAISRVIPHAAKLANVRVTRVDHGTGAWGSADQPNAVAEVLGSPEGAKLFGRLMGLGLQQTEVWTSQVAPASRANRAGLDLWVRKGDLNLGNDAEVSALWKEVIAADPTVGEHLGYSRAISYDDAGQARPAIRIILPEPGTGPFKTAAQYERHIGNLLHKAFGDRLDLVADQVPIELDIARNDWTKEPAGGSYLSEAAAQRPSLVAGTLSDFVSASTKSLQDAARKYAPDGTRAPQEVGLPKYAVEGAPNKPDEGLRGAVQRYAKAQGLTETTRPYAKVDEPTAKRIADAYDAMEHNPTDPAVARSYKALQGDVEKQWQHLKSEGYTLEPWTQPEQPYTNSAEMRADLRDNKHLYFFKGGDLPADHPLAADAGEGLTYNDKFRAVHDAMTHAKEGVEFGPRGEENAWREHFDMFSPEAQGALATETRGQNSWVNFGKHLRDEQGRVPAKGEAGYVPPAERPYAEQKAGLLPEELRTPVEEGQPQFKAGAGEQPPAKPVSLPDVNRALPGFEFADRGDGVLVAPLKEGGEIRVHPGGDVEIPDRQALKASAEAAGLDPEQATVVGSYRRLGKDSLISVTDGDATLDHEAYHFVRDRALHDAEKAAATKRYGDEESEAYAYAEWRKTRVAPNSWFSKVYAYAKRLIHYFNPTWESTFEEVASGRAGERIAGKAGEQGRAAAGGELARAPAYATAPAEPPPGPERPSATDRLKEAALAEGGRVSAKPGAGGEREGPINLDRLNTPDDVKKMFDRATTAALPEIRRAKGRMTLAEIKSQADIIYGKGWFDEKALEKAQRENSALNAAKITAARQMDVGLGKKVTEAALALKHAQDTGGDVFKAEEILEANIWKWKGVLLSTLGRSAEAGRALGAHNILVEGLTPDQRIVRQLAKRNGATLSDESIKDIMTASATGDERALKEAVRKALNPSWFDKFFEVYVNGLLSGPATHIANSASNAGMQSASLVKRGLAAGIEQIRAAVTGTSPERTFDEVNAHLRGIKQGIGDFFEPDSPFNVKRAFKGELPGKIEQYKAAIGGKLGEAVRAPGNALEAMDKLPKAMAFNAEVNVRAGRKARGEATNRGMKGAEAEAYVQKRADEIAKAVRDASFQAVRDDASYKGPYKDVYDAAWEKALYETFQKKAGPLLQAAMNLRESDPSGISKIIMPFMRVAGNIAKITVEHTPLKLVEIISKVRKGQLKGGEISDELAKPLFGALLAIPVVYMAKEGMLTGSGPTDPKERELWRSTGAQPNSVVVPIDGKLTYISYGRLEPLSTLMTMAVDFNEAANAKTRGTAADKIVGTMLNAVNDKTFLAGLSDLVLAWHDPKRYASTLIKDTAGNLVPASSLMRAAAHTVDPVVRERVGVLDAMIANIPGLSQMLPAKPTGTGVPIERQHAAISSLTPFGVSEERPENRIQRLMLDLDFHPSTPQRILTIPGSHGRKVELTREEYNAFEKADRDTTEKLQGMADRIARLPQEQQRAYLERAYSDSARRVRERLYGTSSFRERARAALTQAKAERAQVGAP